MPRIIWLSLLGYVCLFLFYYPPMCGIEDEQGFVNQAIFWSRGALSAEGAGLSSHLGDLMEIGGRHLPIRHPGRSLIALPFYLAGGFHALFLSGMMLQILLTWVLCKALKRLGLDQRFALLGLFHPTLLIYSQTLTADAAAGIGLLASVSALIGPVSVDDQVHTTPADGRIRLSRRQLALAGLGIGLAATMRHHAAVAAPGLALVVYLWGRRLSDVVLLALMSLVGAMPLLAFNLVAYGTLTDPFSAGRGLFSLAYLPQQMPFYLESLNLFWPLLFPAAFYALKNRRLWPVSAVCLSFLLFLGCYYFHDSAAGRIQTDIIGLRLMQVALPVWILGYAVMIQSLICQWLFADRGILQEAYSVPYDVNIYENFPYFTKNCESSFCQNPFCRSFFQNLFCHTCFVMFMMAGLILTGLLFHRHFDRLNDLHQRRLALLRTVPDAAFLLTEGVTGKLIGIYRKDQPEYEPHSVTFHGQKSYDEALLRERIRQGGSIWLVFSPQRPGEEPSAIFRHLASRLHAFEIPTGHSGLRIWRPEVKESPKLSHQKIFGNDEDWHMRTRLFIPGDASAAFSKVGASS
jgi:hypothetical protein